MDMICFGKTRYLQQFKLQKRSEKKIYTMVFLMFFFRIPLDDFEVASRLWIM
jgi:hypothetical protein